METLSELTISALCLRPRIDRASLASALGSQRSWVLMLFDTVEMLLFLFTQLLLVSQADLSRYIWTRLCNAALMRLLESDVGKGFG